MIEKTKGEFICISCGNETPVKFTITDTANKILFSIPLCRQCSDLFAQDKIDTLRKKFELSKERNVSLVIQLKKCKAKISQMNIISHRHKEVISDLMNNIGDKNRKQL